MTLLPVLLTVAFAFGVAAPAAAQRYTARQNGELIELVDTAAQMNVVIVPAMGNAWKIQVKGKDLVRTSPTLAEFKAQPGYNGMPLLAPFDELFLALARSFLSCSISFVR